MNIQWTWSHECPEFEDFLIEKLRANIGLSELEARGRRGYDCWSSCWKGEYTSLGMMEEKTFYYKRVGGQLERDETIPNVKMNNTMRIISKQCAEVDDKCETTEDAQEFTQARGLSSLIKEFNIEYEVSKEEMTRDWKPIRLLQVQTGVVKKLDRDVRYKYNDA